MHNPPPSNPNPGSFDDILNRLVREMRENQVHIQILDTLKEAFETGLSKEFYVLSRPERARPFKQVSIAILTDVRRKFDDTRQQNWYSTNGHLTTHEPDAVGVGGRDTQQSNPASLGTRALGLIQNHRNRTI